MHYHTQPTYLCLAHQREKIRSLEPLKAKIVTVNEDCSERVLAMRAEERHEISVLKKEKMNLLKLIDKKNEEKISLQCEVNELGELTKSTCSCCTCSLGVVTEATPNPGYPSAWNGGAITFPRIPLLSSLCPFQYRLQGGSRHQETLHGLKH